MLEADISYLHRDFDERIWAAVHVLRALGDVRLALNGSVTFIAGALSDRPNGFATAVLTSASAAVPNCQARGADPHEADVEGAGGFARRR